MHNILRVEFFKCFAVQNDYFNSLIFLILIYLKKNIFGPFILKSYFIITDEKFYTSFLHPC